MSGEPPPERTPEPLGFDPLKNRIDRQAAKSAEVVSSLAPLKDGEPYLKGQTVGGRYRVHGVLGEGGMGTVYEAEHLGLGRAVAIKVLSPAQAKKRVAVKRFQQEARAAGAIGHPNICEVYDMGQLDNGSPYLVMEKLVGQTLADRITREGGLPFDDVVDVMVQVLSGLIAAHDKGIVHRDIKPENIFLARRVGCPPVAKILDFGVSKMMATFQGAEEQLDLTRTGMVMGTPYYMSPEQARGQRDLDGRVDVYACGVMMYEAICGKRPFLAPNYNALLLAIINTKPKALREARPATPDVLERIVARAMTKARDDRYPSALQMLQDVQGVSASRGAARVQAPHAPPHAHVQVHAQAGRQERSLERPVDHDAAGNAAARLRKGMSGASPQVQPEQRAQSKAKREDETRLDIRRNATGPNRVAPPSSEFDIPIEINDSDLHAAVAAPEYVDDVQTEVFRPELHAPPSTKDERRNASVKPAPRTPAPSQPIPATYAPPAVARPAAASVRPPPALPSGLPAPGAPMRPSQMPAPMKHPSLPSVGSLGSPAVPMAPQQVAAQHAPAQNQPAQYAPYAQQQPPAQAPSQRPQPQPQARQAPMRAPQGPQAFPYGPPPQHVQPYPNAGVPNAGHPNAGHPNAGVPNAGHPNAPYISQGQHPHGAPPHHQGSFAPQAPYAPAPQPSRAHNNAMPQHAMPAHAYPAGGHPSTGPSAPLNPSSRLPMLDEWESETMVKRPPDMFEPGRPNSGSLEIAPAPFNPDETIRLDRSTEIEIELDASDETRRAPPRRR